MFTDDATPQLHMFTASLPTPRRPRSTPPDPVPPTPKLKPAKLTIDQRFTLWLTSPDGCRAYAAVSELSLTAVRAGRKRFGIAEPWEVARWTIRLETKDPDGFKMNNDFRAPLARLLMARHPELVGVFAIRKRTA